jgi:hypothetical protein
MGKLLRKKHSQRHPACHCEERSSLHHCSNRRLLYKKRSQRYPACHCEERSSLHHCPKRRLLRKNARNDKPGVTFAGTLLFSNNKTSPLQSRSQRREVLDSTRQQIKLIYYRNVLWMSGSGQFGRPLNPQSQSSCHGLRPTENI